MIKRKYLTSCAFGLVLSALHLSSADQAAYAASSQNLTPITGWAVSKVGDVKTDAGYCALARRYTGNVVVTIAQNKSSEASFAFDFQKRVLRTGRHYAVKLMAGDVVREFDVTPASQSALVLKMGEDKPFIKALEISQNLKVKLNSAEYDFQFSDFVGGNGQLESCLGIGGPEFLARQEMGGQLARMKDELGALQSENKTLLSELEAERAKIHNNAGVTEGQTAQIKDLMGKVQLLEQDNSGLLKRLQEEQANAASQSEKKNVTSQAIEAAQQERVELKAMLERERMRREEIEALVKKKEGVEHQQAQLIARIDELEKQNLKLNETLENRGKDSEASSLELAAANKAIESKDEELAALRKEREGLVKVLEQERLDFSKHMTRNSSRSEEVQALSDKLASLEKQNTDLLRDVQAYKDKESSIQDLKAHEETERLAMRNKDVAETKKEVLELKAMLAEERDERMKLSRELFNSKQNKDGAVAIDEAEQKNVAARITRLEAENTLLRRTLLAKNNDGAEGGAPNAAQLAQAKAEIEQYARQLDVLSTERDELKVMLKKEQSRRMDQARALEKKKEITEAKTDLGAKLRELEARNMELSRALEAARQRKTEVVQVSEVVAKPPRMAERGTTHAGSNKGLEQVKTELSVALAERDEYRALLGKERMRLREVQSLRARIGSISGDQASLSGTVRTLQNEKVDLIRALEYERSRLDEIAATKNGKALISSVDSTAKMKAIEAEKRELKRLLEAERAKRHEVNKLEKRFVDVSKDEDHLTQKINKLEAEKSELKRLLMEKDKRTNDVRRLEKMVANVNQDENQLTAKINKLEAEKTELAMLLKNAQREAFAARKNAGDFEKNARNIEPLQSKSGEKDDERILALEERNRKLYSEMQALRAQKSEVDALSAEIDVLKARNSVLKKEVKRRKMEVSNLNAEDDVAAHLKERLNRLEAQNKNLGEALQIARLREEKAIKDNPYREKLLSAESRIHDVLSENAILSRELEAVKEEAERRLLKVENDDEWDIAKATNRFKEAEKEIQRLGIELKKNRELHALEVKELEGKLFDPAITEAEQLRKLREMESEIARLRRSGGIASYPEAQMDVARAAQRRAVDFEPAPVMNEPEVPQAQVRQMPQAAQTPRFALGRAERMIRAGETSRPPVMNPNADGAGDFELSEALRNGGVAVIKNRQVEVPAVPEATEESPVVADISESASVSAAPMAPIMDGPGEFELSEALRNGGVAVIKERQVEVPAEQADMMASGASMSATADENADFEIAKAVRNGGVAVIKERQVVLPPQASNNATAVVNEMPAAPAEAVQQVAVEKPKPRKKKGPNGQDIANLLVKAGVPMVSGFEKVNSVSNATFSAFRWDTGTVYGSAEKVVIPDASQFQSYVDGYLRKTENRCAGSFDKTSSGIVYSQQRPILAYDIACVTDSVNGAGAAILFYMDDGVFNVIAHEGGIDSFDQAMTTRDQVSNMLMR